MKRRDFLAAASASLVPVMLDGFGLKAMTSQSALVQSLLHTGALATDRVLVIVYLNGGNDGLNTVIPRDQYSLYTGLRSNIAIPESVVLALDGNPATGLHPAMTGMRDLYNTGKLSIIHSVSYPNPDQSHYRATDIWMTAVDANVTSDSGWAGRYLENRFPGYPVGYPNAQMEDPLAIQIGYLTSTALLGSQQSMGIALSDPNSFYQLVGSGGTPSPDDLPCCDAGELIAFIRQQQVLSVGYATEIKAAADAGQNMATYPDASAKNSLADQLKIVARLIHGGLKTKIYFVSLSGFDTHSTQVDPTNVLIGTHADLLGKVSTAISAFQQDLKLQGIEDKVVGMTFSEFGRRANSNNSRGTDHGVAAPMFVFGSNLKHRTFGQNPDLANLTGQTGNKDITMQIDFRRVYTDILNDWFGTASTTTNSLLFHPFPTISLFSDTVETVASGNWQDKSIWTVGRVPFANEYVKVNAGHTVTISQNTSVKNIRLDGKLVYTGPYSVQVAG
ncbi:MULTISPECIES: DUF1501 domain-containing protein [unclassified Spirosoma]|uniref:DUF1501 domain-containing protein n=1 Tax=unclassified Spirosoma TaxID=2621999 RepID=UPI0009647E3B|nr:MULTISPECIES: DUF1501 domain-containing protein [unclassified Spirosoma]MBN8825554.1 DUF1501 domain-containing protein [Spirosoma sp.]OJW74198.1 MAG: hypothetical protein BGO59_13850 [Spirosoma sp. 48-14]